MSRGLLAALALLPMAAQAGELVEVARGVEKNTRALAVATSLADDAGARAAGSAGDARAVRWALAAMKEAGLANVHAEPVTVPVWRRGAESGEVLAPVVQPLVLTALGGSVATPPEGTSGEVVEVASLDALRGLPAERVRGRVVFVNVIMKRTASFEGYGNAVGARGRAAVEAAKLGAVGVLIRSIGTGAYRMPHTGAMRYEDGVAKIPAAALAAEDAELLHRLGARGAAVRVRFRLESRELPPAQSANVIGEVRGRALPEEIVVLGAHLDSWDLGPGAQDDAAGCALAIETARLLAARPLRRTLRVVLFANEEHGLSGARAYAVAHAKDKHVAALEADAGAGQPLGVHVASSEASARAVEAALAPLAAMLPTKVSVANEVGADLIPLQLLGVPLAGVAQDATTYFDWHHTAGDTVDKIDAAAFARTNALLAALTLVLVEATEKLAPPPPPSWKP